MYQRDRESCEKNLVVCVYHVKFATRIKGVWFAWKKMGNSCVKFVGRPVRF